MELNGSTENTKDHSILPCKEKKSTPSNNFSISKRNVTPFSQEKVGRNTAHSVPKGKESMADESEKSKRKLTGANIKRPSSKTNLYIRGLPPSMTETELIKLVPDASAIRSVKLVMGNDNECYGFIDFYSNETATKAMQYIKSSNCQHYVNFAYESEKDPLNVYVTNIPESWNADNVETLREIFAPYGNISSALVMTRRSTNTCTGTGFVRYLKSEDAQRAINEIRKANITLKGAKRPLELKLADLQRTREPKIETNFMNSLVLNENASKFHQTGAPKHLSLQEFYNECLGNFLINSYLPSMIPNVVPIIPADFANFKNASFQDMVTCATSCFRTSFNKFSLPTYSLLAPKPGIDPRELGACTTPPIPLTAPAHIGSQFTFIPYMPEPYVESRLEGAPAEKIFNACSTASLGINVNNQTENRGQFVMNTVSPYFKQTNEFSFHCGTAGIFSPTQPMWNRACFYG